MIRLEEYEIELENNIDFIINKKTKKTDKKLVFLISEKEFYIKDNLNNKIENLSIKNLRNFFDRYEKNIFKKNKWFNDYSINTIKMMINTIEIIEDKIVQKIYQYYYNKKDNIIDKDNKNHEYLKALLKFSKVNYKNIKDQRIYYLFCEFLNLKSCLNETYILTYMLTDFIHNNDYNYDLMTQKLSSLTFETEIYFNTYFNHQYIFNNNLSLDERWKLLNNCTNVNFNLIQYAFKKHIDYKYFLKTPFWKVISEVNKKNNNYKCNLCNSLKRLESHHKTYDNYCNELYHMDDLIVLCNDCHSKIHGRKSKRHKGENY